MVTSVPIEIRRIRAGEASALRYIRLRALELDQAAFAASLDENMARPDSHWRDRATESAHSESKAEFLAFDTNGIAVGLVGALRFEDNQDVAELVAMWVEPALRGSGLAARLVDAVVIWCTDVGVQLVELWVTPGNDRAARLYELCGFTQMSPRDGAKQYDGCDTYLSLDVAETG